MCVEKAFKEKKCISSKFELARFHQVTDDMIVQGSMTHAVFFRNPLGSGKIHREQFPPAKCTSNALEGTDLPS